MNLKQSLYSVFLLPLILTACDKAVDTEDNSIDSPNMTAKERASDHKTEQKPETLDERRALREQLAEQQSRNLPERTSEPADEAGLEIGEVPNPIFEKIMADFIAKTRANRDDITVLRTESLTYSDGSLGCGKPGQNYTMAPVPGYRVILNHAGQQFDYRATEKGYFMLCERPSLSAPGASSKPPTM